MYSFWINVNELFARDLPALVHQQRAPNFQYRTRLYRGFVVDFVMDFVVGFVVGFVVDSRNWTRISRSLGLLTFK